MKDQAGWTPVHLAVDVKTPHVAIVEALLQYSPEPALIQEKVRCPAESVPLMCTGKLTSTAAQFGRTPLHLALDRDIVDKEIVYALVNKAWQAVTMKDNVRLAASFRTTRTPRACFFNVVAPMLIVVETQQDERTGLSMLVDHFALSMDGLCQVLDDLPDLVKYRDVVRLPGTDWQPNSSSSYSSASCCLQRRSEVARSCTTWFGSSDRTGRPKRS